MLAPLSASFDGGAKRLRLAIDNRPGDMLSVHPVTMGQIVPIGKDNLSRDSGLIVLHSHAMTTWLDESEFNEALCRRVRELRGARTQAAMAQELGLPLERYKKYETRSPLPAYLVPRLAEASGQSITYVISGSDAQTPTPNRAEINEEALARLLYSLGPALPSDGITERAAQALTAALRRGLELLPSDPSTPPTDAEFAKAAREAMSQFREASQP